ncbi:Rieske 2Fe-2S domain-containing protein [Streptomyces sp. NPDC015127]|uniref:Rieske 2Fe-2S domain-containing protein n=1 Tax=Streptomyces sp. NPDC015127 TaxID=3364939 RepID=UPI0036FA4791
MRERIQRVIQDIGGLTALDGICDKAAGRVQWVTRPTAVKNALSGTWLGHPVHPALTDLPIGAWTTAFFLDLTAGRASASSARRLVGLGLIAAVPTAASGASDWSDTYGPTRRIGLVHALGNSAGTLLQAASWVARRRGRHRLGMALSGVGLGFTVCTAYLGGHLSFALGNGVNHTAFQPTVSDWTDVADLSELGEGQLVRVTPGGVPVVLVQHEGTVFALSATCVHAGGPLDEGKIVEDGCIQCPWHGSTFRLADGRAVRGPAAVDEPSWEVKVTDGRVHVRSSTS